MPLLTLVDEHRTTESQELLFKWFWKLPDREIVNCVADWEVSISNAVKRTLLSSRMVYCWNHILGDVRVSVLSQNILLFCYTLVLSTYRTSAAWRHGNSCVLCLIVGLPVKQVNMGPKW